MPVRPVFLSALLLAALLAGCSGGKQGNDPDGGLADLDPALQERAPGLPPPADLTRATPDGPLVADPLAPGPLATSRIVYDFGFMLADAPNAIPPVYPVAVRGELTIPDGDGPFPLVLFMHGRHGTCAVAGLETLGAYVCPNAIVITPVDSYQGYRPVADLLASHGYVVASIDANHINERDQAVLLALPGSDYGALARGALALQTAAYLEQVNATGAAGTPEFPLGQLTGRIDVSRIGLMGHSRGGEGVARAVVLNNDAGAPKPIKALFALAPTDFAFWQPTGVPMATLLPYCDGDVSNLQGAWLYDDLSYNDEAGAVHQVVAMGANHNFYNSIWTGDDWGTRDDAWCDADGDGRDAPADQMTQGAAVMASFFRMQVGGEAGFDAYWTGAVPFPDAACAKACADRLLLSRMAMADHRFDVSFDGLGATVSGAITATGCTMGTDNPCHQGSIGHAERTNVTWTDAGSLRFDILEGAPAGLDVLTFRIAVGEQEHATLTVRLLDEAGDEALRYRVDDARFAPSPGSVAKKLVLSQVRIPLDGLDVETDVYTVELAFTGSGEIQLADVGFQDEDP